jgi:invasion protein IalB
MLKKRHKFVSLFFVKKIFKKINITTYVQGHDIMINKPMLFLLLATITSLYSVNSAAAEQELFDDWALNCQQSCYIYQGMKSKSQNTIFSLQVSKVNKDTMTMQLNFPLGLYIPAGIGIAIGDFKKNTQLTTCLPKGCHALLVLNDEIKAKLKASKNLKVRFFTGQSQEKEVSFSLKGFQSALNAMDQR